MITRRTLMAAAGAAGLILPTRGVLAQDLTQVTFITPLRYLLSFAPVMVAQGGGHFAEQGLNVEVLGGSGSAMSAQQVLSGQADVGRTGGVNIMNAASQGAPVKSMATIAHGSPFFVMSATSDPVESPRDMVGGVVGLVSKGGATENLLDAMLLSEGIDPQSIERQYTGDNPGAYGLIETGRLKAFIGNVGTMLRARAGGADIVAWNTHRYAPIPGQVYAVTNEHLAERRDTLVAFLKGVRSGIRAIVDQPIEQTIDALSPFPVQGLDDVALVESIIRANQELWLLEGEENLLRNIPENWSKGVDLAVEAGFAESIDPTTLYTNEIVDASAT